MLSFKRNIHVTGGWQGQFKIKSRENGGLLAKEYIEASINDDMNRLEDKQRDIETEQN
ncbi:MAG: hypothetical protein M0P01_11170 [Treponema sp.]|nr:hypothetical protein [Treponema sp.]